MGDRRSGMILDEDFDVFEDQKAADEEMSKEALKGISKLTLFLDVFMF